jgi:hypothetical protein
MRLFYPGQAVLPPFLILFLSVLPVAGYWNLWPIGLIATGLEELYLWATSGDDQ